MTDAAVISQQNPRSGRWTVVAAAGASVWLYLTESDGTEPVADCWLFNTVAPPTNLDAYRPRESAPPVTEAYAGPAAQGSVPVAAAVAFQWSDDGESVAVFVRGELLGLTAAGSKRGFSEHLVATGLLGHPLDEELYARLFRP